MTEDDVKLCCKGEGGAGRMEEREGRSEDDATIPIP